jgi:hypothetical protein
MPSDARSSRATATAVPPSCGRERHNLVAEQPRIVNQMKAIFVRFGIRTFPPTLRKAEEKLKGLRTAEGAPLPENTRAELTAISRGSA